MTKRVPLLLTLAALCLATAPAVAQDDLKAEIEALKKGQEQIRSELQEIKRLLAARPAAPAAPAGPNVAGKVFDLGANPVKGSDQAALTLVEFTDFQCGFCARHHRDTYPRLVENYVDSGKLRYVTLDLPPEQIHKQAFPAAEAAHCAGDQHLYREMHDRLFANQRALEPWNAHAEALGLDVAAFESCLSSGKYADGVRRDMAEARKAGATGTPSFVLARTDAGDPGKVVGIDFIRGAQPYEAFAAAIDSALEGGD